MVFKKANLIIPKIGYDVYSIEKIKDYLISVGYSVHLLLISVDKKTSTKRALSRFIKTNRYVPLSLIFDTYSNDPMLTYYRLKDCKKWASVGKLSTEEESPKVIYGTENSPATILYGGM